MDKVAQGTSMRDRMQTMHAMLRGDCSIQDAADALGGKPEHLQQYRDFVTGHVRRTLEKIYTVLPELLGPEHWQQLVDAFYAQEPPRDYELNHSVAHFVEFLAQLEENAYGISPFHVELAQLEWLEFAVYAHETDIPHGVTQCMLNPTLEILQPQHKVGSFLQAWRDRPHNRPSPDDYQGEEVVFVYRHPTTLHHWFDVADEQLLFAFKMAHDGISVEQAAADAAVPKELVEQSLAGAAQRGIILAPAS